MGGGRGGRTRPDRGVVGLQCFHAVVQSQKTASDAFKLAHMLARMMQKYALCAGVVDSPGEPSDAIYVRVVDSQARRGEGREYDAKALCVLVLLSEGSPGAGVLPYVSYCYYY